MKTEKESFWTIIIGFDWESFNWALFSVSFSLILFMLQRLRCYIKWRRTRIRAQKVSMVRVDVPFTTSLELERNVVAVVSSSVKCRIEVYWWINIQDFHRYIKALWSEELVLKHCVSSTYASLEMDNGEKRVLLDCGRSVDTYASSSIPRSHYPVVIIVRNMCNSLKPNEGQGLISIVHLGDVATSARIIAQSLKLASGQVTLLQKLFPSGLYEKGTDDICVVCVVKPVSRVVLPCKHACLCNFCFERVYTCPMCRARIESFFCISSELEGTSEKNWAKKCHSFIKSVWLRL